MATKGFTTGQAPAEIAGMDQYQKAALEELARQQQEVFAGANGQNMSADQINALRDQAGAIDYKSAQQTALKNMMGSSLNPGEYMAALQQMGNYGEDQRDQYSRSAAGKLQMDRMKAQRANAMYNQQQAEIQRNQQERQQRVNNYKQEKQFQQDSVGILNNNGPLQQQTSNQGYVYGVSDQQQNPKKKKQVESIGNNNQFNSNVGVGIDTGSN